MIHLSWPIGGLVCVGGAMRGLLWCTVLAPIHVWRARFQVEINKGAAKKGKKGKEGKAAGVS